MHSEVKTPKCYYCDSENTEYVGDQDHDGGTCEIRRCLDCKRKLHFELPD